MQDNSWIPLFPEQASTFAWEVDVLYFYLIAISIFFTVAVVAAVAFFVVKYREKEKFANGAEIHGSVPLELFFFFFPFVISITIFFCVAIIYYKHYRPP